MTEIPTYAEALGTDVAEVRRRLVKHSDDLHQRSVPYIESMLPESGVPIPSHGRAIRDAAEGLIAGNVFAYTLAAVLRVAAESDHPAGPILAERMARMVAEAMNSGLDWLEGANDDLPDAPQPPAQVPGQQAETRHFSPSYPGEFPDHLGRADACPMPACAASRGPGARTADEENR